MPAGYITQPMRYISGGLCVLLNGLLLGLVCLYAGQAIADETSELARPAPEFVGPPLELAGPQPELPPVVEEPNSLFAAVDEPRDYLSEKIVTFTKQVDQFFGDERYFQEHNKSVVQLGLSQSFAQGGGRSFSFEGQAKIDLPAAQRRFQFVLESNPEKKATEEAKKDQPVASQETAKPDQYAASLRYEKAEESRWHYSLDSGAHLQFPLDPFVRARSSYSIQFGEWRVKLAEALFWFSKMGVGETTQLDFERVLSAPLLFRATSTATCMEAPQNCDLRQDLSFYHTLDERTAVVYQASVLGVSNPKQQETAYILSMRYRHRLHRDWVFYEISPQLSFPRTDNFRLNALLQLRLEMLFGETR